MCTESPQIYIQNTGWTPMVFAARQGQVEIVKHLISRRANLNILDKVQIKIHS